MSLKLCFQIAKSTKKSISTIDLNTATSTSTSDVALTAESLQLSDFFYSRATNIIQPLLGYCKYELTREGKLKKEEIASICDYGGNIADEDEGDEVEENDLIQQKQLADKIDDNLTANITFRGETVSVEEQPTVKMMLIKINATKEKLESLMSSAAASSKKKKVKASMKDSTFMELLNCYDDAVSLISKTLKDYQGMTSGPAVNQKKFECSLVMGYFQYSKIQMLMDRNEKMVNDLKAGDQEIIGLSGDKKSTTGSFVQEDSDAKYKRVEEIAHLYDALLQDAKSIVRLPGGKSEEGEDLEDEFVLQANANVLRFRALRCYYIGRMYATDNVAKYNEALALFDQAGLLASEAAEEIAACQEMEMADELVESMASLKREISTVQVRTRASAFLASQGSEASSAASGLHLLCRLDDFDSGGMTHRVADVPFSLKPIPSKPAFFDIANNYVNEFPIDELERHTGAVGSKTNRGGFMSWFGKII